MRIKAIQTSYQGYKFRSRLEARWAVFFDELGIKWEYEKEGYDLGKAGWYLPDFWLPDEKIWVEIKGQTPTKDEKGKMESLFDMTNHPVVLLFGTPRDHILDCYLMEVADGGGGYGWHNGDFHLYSYGKAPGLWIGIIRGKNHAVNFYDGDNNGDIRFFDSTHDFIIITPDDADKYHNAIKAARSARFEHR